MLNFFELEFALEFCPGRILYSSNAKIPFEVNANSDSIPIRSVPSTPNPIALILDTLNRHRSQRKIF